MKVVALDSIIGQKPAVTLLKTGLKSSKFFHSYLFTGIKGVGKTTTANAFVFHLLCKEKKSPCGECSSCKKLIKEVHPDVLKIFPEKKEITIKQVREVIQFLKYRPIEGEYKVIIIDQAEKMNLEAANALLKSLEEPPEFAIFILITENFTKLLPTIVSRSQVVRFHSLPKEVIVKELKKRYWFEDEVAESLADISQGSLGFAMELAEKGGLEELSAFVKAGLSQDFQVKFRIVERLAALEKERIETFFYLLYMWIWRSYIFNKLKSGYPKAFPEEKFVGKPYEVFKLIEEVRQALERYVNPELAFLSLMLGIFSDSREYQVRPQLQTSP